jgi:hypothetical protein
MKVDALIDTGYKMLMREGILLTDAIARSSPMYRATASAQEKLATASRIHVQQVFGAMSKNAFPIQSLLAAAKCASAYTAASAKGSVLIIPHGIPEVLKYTRRESMVYEIAGPAIASNGPPIKMSMDDVFVDDSTSVKIMIHHPLPNFQHGYAHPSNQRSPLQNSSAEFSVFYPLNEDYNSLDDTSPFDDRKLVNLVDGGWHTPQYAPTALMLRNAIQGSDDTYYHFLLRPKISAIMSSAILAAPGHQTGSLLVGYPFTSVSTSSQEMMQLQLRVYLGAVLRRPENVIVMKDVYFEGLSDGHKPGTIGPYDDSKECGIDLSNHQFLLGRVLKTDAPHWPQRLDFFDGTSGSSKVEVATTTPGASWKPIFNGALAGGTFTPAPASLSKDQRDKWPKSSYCGTVYTKGDTPTAVHENMAHMGSLDHPNRTPRLHGSFVYSGSQADTI